MFIFLLTIATVVVTSCNSSSPLNVSLDELDDFYTVKSYKLESDAKEKGIEKLGYAKGTLTMVVVRNKNEMKYMPSDVCAAEVYGAVSLRSVFEGECDAVIKQMLKMAPGTKETFTIGIKGIDPYNEFSSEEKNTNNRQNAYDALTKKGCLDQICFDIVFKNEIMENLKDLKELFD